MRRRLETQAGRQPSSRRVPLNRRVLLQMAAGPDGGFKGRHFTSEVILWALRWYLAFPISYRDLAAMLSDRGVWSITRRCSAGCRPMPPSWSSGSGGICGRAPDRWRVDETYIEVKGAWTYLYRAVDSLGQTIDFLLSAQRTPCGEAVLPQGAGPAAHRQPANDHGGQEPGLSACGGGHEAGGRTLALLAAATVQIPEQHRRAGSPQDQTAGPAGAWLRRSANGETDAGGLRGDGDDQEGAGSQYWRSRHAGANCLRRRPFQARRLKHHLSAPRISTSRVCNRTPGRLIPR